MRQYLIKVDESFRGTVTARFGNHGVTVIAPEEQPEPEVELVDVTEPDQSRLSKVLEQLANHRAETREDTLTAFNTAVDSGCEIWAAEGKRPHIWIRAGKAKLGLNSASLSVEITHNPPEVLDLAETLPGATRPHPNRVNFSRQPEHLAAVFEAFKLM